MGSNPTPSAIHSRGTDSRVEMKFLRGVEHWIHGVPVTYVVWFCTVVGVVLLILSARWFVRRLSRVGFLSPIRLLVSVVLVICGGLLLVWLDSGARFPRIHPVQAEATTTEYKQLVKATTTSFSEFDYHEAALQLSKVRDVIGVVPELQLSRAWTDLRTDSTFRVPSTGIPRGFGTSFFLRRSVSASVRSKLSALHDRLSHLRAGHVFVTATTARLEGIRTSDTLELQTAAGLTYWTVQGVIRPTLLVPDTGIILPLHVAQSDIVGTPEVSNLVVFLSVEGAKVSGQTHSAVAQAMAGLPASPSGTPVLVFRVVRHFALPVDWTRRVTIGAVFLMLLGASSLWILSRRRVVPV